jgi:retron-type reverse transcriptase
MKRLNNLFALISDYDNIATAFYKAARGKRHHKYVIDFLNYYDHNIRKIQGDIQAKNVTVGDYHYFLINDPKPRNICAASFSERILHHAIMNIIEPRLEKFAIYDSYACRKGKGSHCAIFRAQDFSKKSLWYLKLDIARYFDSIDQTIMIQLIFKRFKDPDLIQLLQKILETYHTEPGKGVPIGNLISQHLANFYLGHLDHWIKEIRKIKYYVRYMDDFILFANDKTVLKNELIEIKMFLKNNLELYVKENQIQLNHCSRGFPFLGYRVFPEKILLSPRSKKRFQRKFKAYENNWKKGKWSLEELNEHMGPLIEFTKLADSGAFRQRVIKRFGVSS